MAAHNHLELHYYFPDDSHTINAAVRHDCEAEILAILNEAASILGMQVSIDAIAAEEGGFKEGYKIFCEHSGPISAFASIAGLLIATVSLIQNAPDSEYINLQKEELKLTVELRRHQLAQLKKETEREGGEASEESINNAVNILNHSPKIAVRKSNFYRRLSTYEKVTQLGISTYGGMADKSEETIIPKEDFYQHILRKTDVEPRRDEDALIEIVAPILRESRAKWKGIYQEQLISFSMGDNEYAQEVLSGQRSFSTGVAIRAVLVATQKLNEVGEIEIKGWEVETVLSHITGSTEIETVSAAKYRQTKRQGEQQDDLFADPEKDG